MFLKIYSALVSILAMGLLAVILFRDSAETKQIPNTLSQNTLRCDTSSVQSAATSQLPKVRDNTPTLSAGSSRAMLAPPSQSNELTTNEIIRTEEDLLGTEKFQQLQETKVAKNRQLQQLQAERTLYYLSDALGLHLTPDQTALGLNLLANAEDSQDLVSDQEVSFLSRKLSLDSKQRTALRETISQVQSATDEDLARLVPDWNGTIPPELKDLEGEVDSVRVRNQAIEHLLANKLSPKQLEDLKSIQTLESPEVE